MPAASGGGAQGGCVMVTAGSRAATEVTC